MDRLGGTGPAGAWQVAERRGGDGAPGHGNLPSRPPEAHRPGSRTPGRGSGGRDAVGLGRPLVVRGRERRGRGLLGARTVDRAPVFGAGLGPPRRVPVEAGPHGAGRWPRQAAARLRLYPGLPVRLGVPVGVRPGGPVRGPFGVRLGSRRLVRPPVLRRLVLRPLPVGARLLPGGSPVGARPAACGYAPLVIAPVRATLPARLGGPLPLRVGGPVAARVGGAITLRGGGSVAAGVGRVLPLRIGGPVAARIGGTVPLRRCRAIPLGGVLAARARRTVPLPAGRAFALTVGGTGLRGGGSPLVAGPVRVPAGLAVGGAVGSALGSGRSGAVGAAFGPAAVALRPVVVAGVGVSVRRGTAWRGVLVGLREPAGFGPAGGGDGAVPAGRLVARGAGVVAVGARVVALSGGVGGPAGGAESAPVVAVRLLLPGRPLAVVGPARVGVRGAVRLVAVPSPVEAVPRVLPAGTPVGQVVPRAADVRPVGSGRRERGHLGPADGRAAPSRGRRVFDADVARVALAGELGVPLGGRLDHPGRFGGVVPVVGVAAHPVGPSPRRVGVTPATGRRGAGAPGCPTGVRPLTAAPRWPARVRSLTAMSPRCKVVALGAPRAGRAAPPVRRGCGRRVAASARSPPLWHRPPPQTLSYGSGHLRL